MELHDYLQVAIVQLHRQSLLAGVRHGLTVGLDGSRCVSPALTVQALRREDVKLSLSNAVMGAQKIAY